MKSFTLFTLIFIRNTIQAATLKKYSKGATINGKAINSSVKLTQNDRLEAIGKKEYFIVEYDDGSKFFVRNGKLIIEELKENHIRKESLFSLISGFFVSFINPKSEHKFRIKSRDSILGVRGTKFLVDSSDKKLYLCVCEGEVEASSKGRFISVTKGMDLIIEKDSSKKLKVTRANDQMWQMAVDGFKELDISIPSGLNK